MFTNVICQICTDQYDAEKDVAAMPCGHTFHDSCLDRWLTTTRNCPSCRKPLKRNQNPIRRLYFSVDQNCSQVASSSPKSTDPLLLENNRKLQAQISALQAAIEKLKTECQECRDAKLTLTRALAVKNDEVQALGKTEDKLKRKMRRELSARQSELDNVKDQLTHLRNVQTIIEGVEEEVKQMLEEKVGYTPQQLTYVVLLRQQLDSARAANMKLRKEAAEAKRNLLLSEKQHHKCEGEMKLMKLELDQAETHNATLRRKCEKLIASINSPSGVSASLAKRVIYQSPAPQFVTPNAVHPSTSDKENVPINSEDESVRLSLKFDEEAEEPAAVVKKQRKYIGCKSKLTQDRKDIGDASPAADISFQPCMPRKHSVVVKPLQMKRPPNVVTTAANGAKKSKFFRQGFDGMGGQAQTFSRTQNAMEFNVFKKPVAPKSTQVIASSSAGTSTEEVIVIH